MYIVLDLFTLLYYINAASSLFLEFLIVVEYSFSFEQVIHACHV
jgi:hypothetical protein